MIRMEETGNGGDYVVSNDGILLDNSLDTIGYISWFGGNVKENTVQARKPKGRLYFDFWGNCDVFDCYVASTRQVHSFIRRFSCSLKRVAGANDYDVVSLHHNPIGIACDVSG